MAVFTVVDEAELRAWLAENYDLALDSEPEPVAEGIENTNYFISCEETRYVFTILEVWDHEMAGFCASLAQHLASKGARVPPVKAGKKGDLCLSYQGKPATVTTFIEGRPRLQPDVISCVRMGEAIAELHVAAAGFNGEQENKRGEQWRLKTAAKIAPGLNASDKELLDRALAIHESYAAAELPRAACHCDLFRNNVLWNGGEIAGIIDFYFAGVDTFIFDLAVAGVDWCMDDEGELSLDRLAAMVDAYREKRAMEEVERRHLPQAFAVGALRFWLSRINDLAEPREASMLCTHNPGAFRRRLRSVIDQAAELSRLA